MELPKFIFQASENLVEKPWGGEWIALLKGFRKKGIGEAWEFSAHPSNPSQVLLKKNIAKLTEVIIEAKKEILGKLSEKYQNFPLLVKIIETTERLEPHLHPSAKIAESLGESDGGKMKAWIMVSGNAYIGFSEDFTLEKFEEIRKEGAIWEKMNSFSATAYDTFLIPCGVLHSVESARFVEISTNAELSFSINDDRIKKAIKLSKTEDFEVKGKRGRIETEFFGAEVLDVVGRVDFAIDTFNILLCLEGYAMLRSEKELVDLQKGYSCLVPAITANYSIQSEKAKVLRIYPK